MENKVKIRTAHRTLLIVIASLVAITTIGIAVLYSLSNQSIDKQKAEHATYLKKLDDKNKQLQQEQARKKAIAEKLAAEEKARKQAEQKKTDSKKQAAKNKPAATANTANCKASDTHSNPNSIAVVINKKRCFSPLDFVPSDLVTVHGATISSKASTDFSNMVAAINKAVTSSKLRVTSSYRSYANQVSTYNYWVSVNGSRAAADTVSARPGYSEHQTGFTVDLAAGSCSLDCFGGSAQYKWLKKHAAEYGFVERYPKGMTSITGYSPESWHWRYVGSSVALDMRSSGITTLEQYWGLKGGDY